MEEKTARDPRTRRILHRSARPAFVAGFAILGEVLLNFLMGSLGLLVGGLVGGVLLLTLVPLQRLGERLVGPGVATPTPTHAAGRRSLYFDQARIVWRDGVMTQKERFLLEHLRVRLHLSVEEAAQLEREAFRGPGRKDRQGGSPACFHGHPRASPNAPPAGSSVGANAAPAASAALARSGSPFAWS